MIKCYTHCYYRFGIVGQDGFVFIVMLHEMPCDCLHDGEECRRSVAFRAFEALVASAGVIVIRANRANCDTIHGRPLQEGAKA